LTARAEASAKIEAMLRHLAAVLRLLSMLLPVGGGLTMPAEAASLRFRAVAPGIEHARFEVQPGDAERFSGHAFKIDLEVAELRLVPAGGPSSRRTVEEIVAWAWRSTRDDSSPAAGVRAGARS
jgi:hypothetical protein